LEAKYQKPNPLNMDLYHTELYTYFNWNVEEYRSI